MNQLDLVLQTVCPTVMVGRYEPLALLDSDGHRFLMAEDGVHVEVLRPWLHVISKVSEVAVKMPYGQVPALFKINLHRRALAAGLRRFIGRAAELAPDEHAAWLTFDPDQGAIGYVEPLVISRGREHIQYRRPDATPSCLPVVDCHSHGTSPAFFSGTDDKDDRTDDAKLAFVVGNLDQPTPSVAMRLSMMGLSIDLSEFVRSILDHSPAATDGGTENEDDRTH